MVARLLLVAAFAALAALYLATDTAEVNAAIPGWMR